MTTNRIRSLRGLAILGVLFTTSLNLCLSQEEEDSVEVDEPWNVSTNASYLSRYTSFGVDLSEDEPGVLLEASLTHASGVSFGVDALGRTGEHSGYQQSSFHLGYERELTKSFKVSGIYSYYSYSNDTVSVLAGISNSLGFGATLNIAPVTFGVGYNVFFGNASANYFSGTVGAAWQFGNLSLGPTVQACVASQSVNVALLPKNRGKGMGNGQGQSKKGGGGTTGSVTTESITGLSSLNVTLAVSYALGKGFSASLAPAYQYSPTDLGARSSQFILTATFEYSLDF